MKQGELKRRITKYLASDMSEFKAKDDQNVGWMVTHLIESSRVRSVVEIAFDARRQRIIAAKTSDAKIAEIVCLNICKKLIDERYQMCLDNAFSDGKIDIKTATDFLNYAFTVLDLNVTLDGRNIIDEYYKVENDREVCYGGICCPRSWWDAPYVRKGDRRP